MNKRLELLYSGRLDQTNFRDQVDLFAQAHHLTGFVSKLADGRVKVVAEGAEGELTIFLHDLNEYMADFIEHYSKTWLAASGEYDRFRFLNI